jgi:hypothetical protein
LLVYRNGSLTPLVQNALLHHIGRHSCIHPNCSDEY